MSFTAQDVMALRAKTGLGMMDCKKALAEHNGDPAKAEEWLRAQRKGKMDARTERTTGEGRIGVAFRDDRAVMVEIRTETDFTARNEDFVKMVEDVTQAALDLKPGELAEPNEFMTKRIDDVRIVTGENANFARGIMLTGGHFGHYVHFDGKRAALLQVSGEVDADTLKGICQHIVFHDPAGIDEKDVPAEVTDRIRAEALDEAKASGKNDEIAAKIADGKVRRHLQDTLLLYQAYILDESKSVKDILPKGVNVTKFIRYTLGS